MLLTEHHLEFLSLKGDCTGWSESTLVKMPHCRKSHVVAQLLELVQGILLLIEYQSVSSEGSDQTWQMHSLARAIILPHIKLGY